jgi:hypothetical protein
MTIKDPNLFLKSECGHRYLETVCSCDTHSAEPEKDPNLCRVPLCSGAEEQGGWV